MRLRAHTGRGSGLSHSFKHSIHAVALAHFKDGKTESRVVKLLSQGLIAIKYRLWDLNPETVFLNTMGMAIHKLQSEK